MPFMDTLNVDSTLFGSAFAAGLSTDLPNNTANIGSTLTRYASSSEAAPYYEF